jgi:hypothetical protein
MQKHLSLDVKKDMGVATDRLEKRPELAAELVTQLDAFCAIALSKTPSKEKTNTSKTLAKSPSKPSFSNILSIQKLRNCCAIKPKTTTTKSFALGPKINSFA